MKVSPFFVYDSESTGVLNAHWIRRNALISTRLLVRVFLRSLYLFQVHHVMVLLMPLLH